MKNDLEIQQDVIHQLSWEPFLKASDIGVTVKNGIVTLTGEVDSYYKKNLCRKSCQKSCWREGHCRGHTAQGFTLIY